MQQKIGNSHKTSKLKVPERQLLAVSRELRTLHFTGAGLLSNRRVSFPGKSELLPLQPQKQPGLEGVL